MENLLFINACVRGERSRTLKLARRFLEGYQKAHPDTVITQRDLCAQRLQPQYPEVLAERDELWAAGKLDQPMFEPAREFAAADKIVVAAPFWDLCFPAILKIYLERVTESGKRIFVPGYDMAVAEHYEDFVKQLKVLEPPLDKHFVEIMDEQLDTLPLEMSEMFIDGFRLGARMMIEIYQKDFTDTCE